MSSPATPTGAASPTTHNPRLRATSLSLAWLLASAWSLAGAQSAPQMAEITREITHRVEVLQAVGSIQLDGGSVQRSEVLVALYQRRSGRPLWSDRGRAAELLQAIRSVREDGLDPDDYHLRALEGTQKTASAARAAELDLLRTDAFVRLVHDLRHGKLGSAESGSVADLFRLPLGPDVVADVEGTIEGPHLAQALGALRPRHFVYVGLVRALADLRRIEEAGGWPHIPNGIPLQLDSTDARVPILRQRLAVEGDLTPDAVGPSSVFDSTLENAVRRFQHRHGLNEDGVVGYATIRELNVPVGDRIAQVRVNLERARWLTHSLPNTFVVVNIAGAKVYLVRDGAVVFETRAIVGAKYTRTPRFQATLQHVELNPTWTVPPSIVGEVLAEVRQDPAYLERQGLRVLDRSGNPVDPSSIDFTSLGEEDFPWILRQDPGPLNPLGRIKFVFPNAHNVYLHDTPRRDLFEREERLFSHGCIRVQNPFGLAELLIDDPTRWDRSMLESASLSGEPLVIPLAHPRPVLIEYWTASVDESGVLHFYRDVYGRDPAVLTALGRS